MPAAPDLTLFLIRDSAEPEMWIDTWARSYPLVQTLACSAGESISGWQTRINSAWQQIPEQAMIVAHGAGTVAAMAWQFQNSLVNQQRIRGMILVSPLQSACTDDAHHTLQRARTNCKAALVIGQGENPLCPTAWAAKMADLWQARLLRAPQSGHLNQRFGGWQWGMQLMQEMLHAN
ncbi:alpha/beta hydrolase [Eikenella sp. S3360]|uniref:Alpha/beta hydrolase n=1 Tax=Eikenella glucosivorans TaxID=2766967 RepID=A0ABS0NC31_9NEIS|nr:alpha/beta hydrolase [Eikenella glucosivorans]MBH5329886.1 alpha/beta hydrolase [Eikenella glucosivorans]